jgi:hydroxypyruvate isomerase
MQIPVGLRYDVNCSLLFTELPLLDRPAAARAAGFTAIEFWWPFPVAVPPDRDVDRFIAAVRDSGVALVGLNFFAGDLAGPDCGLVSIPRRLNEFRDSVELAVYIGGQLRVPCFNALFGNRDELLDAAAQDDLAAQNLTFAAERVSALGASIVIEPISGQKPYPLRTAADVMKVVTSLQRDGVANAGLLLDSYHLDENGDDVGAAIDSYIRDIRHVQIADSPGRGAPGTGTADIVGYLNNLSRLGYDGWVGLEYKPAGSTTDSLAWLPWPARAGVPASQPDGRDA